MARRYVLRDDQWDRIRDLLPGRVGHIGVTAKDNRLFIEAVLYRYRAGIPWRDLPERFGDFRMIHLRHSRWSRAGVWQRAFQALSEDADNEYAMIDSTIVRAHQHSAGAKGEEPQAVGRSRGGLSSKIHSVVDALGNPVAFHLSAGQASDLEGADVLLPHVSVGALLADRAYDASARVIEPVQRQGTQIVILSHPTRKVQRDYDRVLYKNRHLIENSFAKLKQYRAIATLYDKTACNFLGAIYWIASVILLN
ncbi:IS5 family transposase [Xanthomonas cannabis]|uniref:IS5 family transposase n=1 Tax=Xanthomonas cannabis TaxID=1885674 RepID=UPI000573CFA7|nr:IS5 family transposase [Xanthomonas cannabis]KHL51324.1 transposase [Xanthomonas cannabis pv. cannabis]KHL57627.1 transposase [Xanthomonas cannabis pv. cannabis]MCC8442840.1 IS5 family transposase [Xanthomonas cannabis]